MRTVIVTALVAVTLAACGGSSAKEDAPRVLHLGSGDITEHDFTVKVRAAFSAEDSKTLCDSLRGLSDKEAAEAIVASQPADLATVQAADGDDRARAAALLKAECDRIY